MGKPQRDTFAYAEILHRCFTSLNWLQLEKVSPSFTMVAGYSDGDPILKDCIVTLLPFWEILL